MKEKIKEILMDIRPDVDYDNEDALIDGHILESFDIVSLVGELANEFGIVIKPRNLVAENFNSLNAITALVESLTKNGVKRG